MKATFNQLTEFLLRQQDFWRFEPFLQSLHFGYPSAWQQNMPQLIDWLTKLDLKHVEALQDDAKLHIAELSPFFPEIVELQYSLNSFVLPTEIAQQPQGAESRLLTGVPGRKMAQILAITQEIGRQSGVKGPWLEWCSGKGYLGRLLAYRYQAPVVSFEFQQALCNDGQAFADQQHLPMCFVQGDAFDANAKTLFESKAHVVALHACGDLHTVMLKHAVEHHCQAISFSPCCYHLIKSESYQPLSVTAQQSALLLSRNELRIPLQETVTGGERVRRHRQTEMVYRLGFQALGKDVLGFGDYETVPSIKKSLLDSGFTHFCRWACDEKGWTLPAAVDWCHYQSIGEQQFQLMEKLSAVQGAFRRLLEWWLVLDRMLFLDEHGYDVTVSEFCSRAITPRNFFIQGMKRS